MEQWSRGRKDWNQRIDMNDTSMSFVLLYPFTTVACTVACIRESSHCMLLLPRFQHMENGWSSANDVWCYWRTAGGSWLSLFVALSATEWCTSAMICDHNRRLPLWHQIESKLIHFMNALSYRSLVKWTSIGNKLELIQLDWTENCWWLNSLFISVLFPPSDTLLGNFLICSEQQRQGTPTPTRLAKFENPKRVD